MDARLSLKYDPNTEVVRVRTLENLEDSVAVPLEDLTILVSSTLDRVVGINIQDLPTFVKRYVSDQLIPDEPQGEALFRVAKPHLEASMSLLFRNLGPIAKDRVAHWDELVEERIRKIEAGH